MKFRLLAGKHIQNNAAGDEVCYSPGDVVENDSDLALRWPEKFEYIREGSTNPLDGMSDQQIQEYLAQRSRQRTGEGSVPQPNPVQKAVEEGFHPQSHLPSEQRTGAVKSDTLTEEQAKDRAENPTVQRPPHPMTGKQHPVPQPKLTDDATVERMTLKQLQELAEEEEIDLKGATRREDILRIVKAHKRP